MLKIIYNGKNWKSRNWCDTTHWTKRQKVKEEFWSEIEPLLEVITNLSGKTFTVKIKYNSRFDNDNVFGSAKWVLDYLKKMGHITDDCPKFYKTTIINFDDTLPKGTYVVEVL
jgi:hypothetical protein